MLAGASVYVFLAVVESLPEPGDQRPVRQKLYVSFYRTLHLLANKVIEKRPQYQLPTVAPQTQITKPPTV